MKRIFIFLSFWILAGCSAKQDFNPTAISLSSPCEGNADCTIKIMPNKGLFVQTGSNDKSNSLVYVIEDNPDKNVIVYKFKKTPKGHIQDANYHEEIVFELDKNATALHLNDGQLQTAKMIFGRFCFCKGQTGLFAVKQGTLAIDAGHNGELNFTVPEVPQVTKQIRFSLK